MYTRLCKTLTDKGTFVPTNEDIYKYIDDVEVDHYVSVYKYNEEQKKHFDEKGTVSGIQNVVTNQLVFDLDSEDRQQALDDTKTLLERLERKGISNNNTEVYMSGNKGFHVQINIDKYLTPTEEKNIAQAFAGDLSSFDSTVYNANRILRLAGTKHPKSGLYKRKVSHNIIKEKSLDDIVKMAEKSYKAKSSKTIRLSNAVLKLGKEKPKVEKKEEKDERSFVELGLDISKRPPYLSPWKYALEQGYFPEGTKNDAILILASTYKAAGYDKTKSYYAIKAVCEKQSEIFKSPKVEKDDIYTRIDRVYGPDWGEGCYAEDNFPIKLQDYLTKDLGIPRRDEVELEVFENTSSVFKTFTKFAENIDKNTIKTGIKAVDDNVRMTTGMLCGLLGSPSSGKTNCCLEILRNTSLNNENAAFYSLDMGSSLVFQRLAQKLTGHSSDTLFNFFKQKKNKEIDEIYNKIEHNYKNVSFSFKTAMTVDDIRKSITHQEQKTGQKFRLVVIDYLECITATISDPIAKVSMISQQLKDLAIDLDVCVLLLLQPPKRVGDPSQPIKSYTDIKGSATVAQACSVVLTLWREGFSPDLPENDRYISFAVVKNRLGSLSQTDCSFDGLTGDIGELDDAGRDNLRAIRALKKLNNSDGHDI